MPTPADAPSGDPRVYLAAERTLLAWIRTALALMGFGFVVARFGLFLREITAMHPERGARTTTTGFSLWTGVALVLLAVVVLLSAAVDHLREIRQFYPTPNFGVRRCPTAVLLCLALVVIGLLMVIQLIISG